MTTTIQDLEKQIAEEKDERKKAELRRALDALKRQEQATDPADRPDYRDPNFKQIANEPESGEELGNAIARTNRMQGPLPETGKLAAKEKAQPPVEAGNINVDTDEATGRRTVTVEGGGQPSKPADVPAHSDKKADGENKE